MMYPVRLMQPARGTTLQNELPKRLFKETFRMRTVDAKDRLNVPKMIPLNWYQYCKMFLP